VKEVERDIELESAGGVTGVRGRDMGEEEV